MDVAILCGGYGKRMGMVNKGRLKLCGMDFIEILYRNLSKLGRVFVVGRPEDFQEYEAFDDLVKGVGPLGGIARALKESSTDKALIVPCDTPLFDSKVASQMIEMVEDYEIVAFYLERITPIPGVYDTRILDLLLKYLRSGERSITGFILQRKTLLIHPRSWERIKGVNTREEYEELLRKTKCEEVIDR